MKNKAEKNFSLTAGGYTLYSNGGNTTQRWFFYYYKMLPAGVRKRVRVYGYINRHATPDARYKAAEALLKKLLRGEGQTTDFESVKLHRLFSEYFETRCKHLRTKTRHTYLTKVNSFIDYCGRKKTDSLQLVNRKFATAFLDSIKRGPTTKNTYRDTLRTFFEDFKRDKLIAENPFAGIAKMPEARRGKFPFSPTQVNQLKTAIKEKNETLWMGCLLQYYCFIRPGESRQLRVEDVNLDEDFILLHASISKNKKTQPVCIPAAFKPELRQWLSGLPQNAYILTRTPGTTGRDYLNKQHKKILNTLGYSARYSFYSWKHTGAVAAVKAGVGLKDLQLQMRHHSLDQLNEYLREMGILDSDNLRKNFPKV